MNLNTEIATQIVIPLTKIDHERRMVIGVAALEQADLTKEIMDYETAKPAFQTWSKSFEDATGGLSKGNLRVMHGKHVAGRLDQIAFNDEAKQIEVCAKVTDENEWQKVLDGNYTGFSVGGGYAKKWKDGDLTRYTPRVAELSLVDSPCMPGARFAELLKADGMVEMLELRGAPEPPPPTFGDLMKADAAPKGTFAELWAAQNVPLTFGDLAKAQAGTIAGGLVGGALGLAAGGPVGALAGGALGAGLAGVAEGKVHMAQYHQRQRAAKTCPTCGQVMPKAKNAGA